MINLKIQLYSLLFLSFFFNCTSPSKNHKPNILFLYIDDLGWKDVGYMGNKYHETPNIDQIATEGMVFTNAYANAPNCAPSRACLMTGQYSPRHGIYTVLSANRGNTENRKLIPVKNKTILPSEQYTLAEALSDNEYICGHFGKWHLGDSLTGPLNQGFHYNFGGNKKGHPKSYFSPYKNKNLSDGKKGEHLTDRLTNEALLFMEKYSSRPFFLYFSFYAVHTPFQAKDSLIQKYRSKTPIPDKNNPTYAAMLETVDFNIGRLLNKLKELNLDKNTIVVFYSDNGNHFKASSAQPLRGSKGMLYEGGIRVPLAIKWPKKIKSHAICETPVIGTDFFPSFLNLIGVKKPDSLLLDGMDISPLLFNQKPKQDRALYWHFPAYLEAYGGMQLKWRQTPASAIRKGNWKLIETFESQKLELFNVKNDIGEQNDLSEINIEKRNELYGALKKWQKEIDAFVNFEMNPYFKK